MSMITRCPACETLFKVVPDQLRISEGWVRCGQCDEIFDASAHGVKEVPTAPVSNAVAIEPLGTLAPVPVLSIETVLGAAPAAMSQFQDLDLDFSEMEKSETQKPDRPPIDLDFGDAPASHGHRSMESDSAAARSVLPLTGQQTAVLPVEPEPMSDAVQEPENSGAAEVSFLRPQDTPSRWRRPLVRAGLSAIALALLLTLAGQFMVHERDSLAAHEPRLTPWLTAMCLPLACSVSAVQRIEAVVIESSSFARVQDDIYRLSFTLKNTASIPLAMPAIELTLTDTLDQPLLRRIVLRQEFDAVPEILAPGLTKPATATFLVKLDAASQRMAGYRLLAFYP